MLLVRGCPVTDDPITAAATAGVSNEHAGFALAGCVAALCVESHPAKTARTTNQVARKALRRCRTSESQPRKRLRATSVWPDSWSSPNDGLSGSVASLVGSWSGSPRHLAIDYGSAKSATRTRGDSVFPSSLDTSVPDTQDRRSPYGGAWLGKCWLGGVS